MRRSMFLAALLAVVLVITACAGPAPTSVPQVKVEEKIVEKIITPTPQPKTVKIQFWHHTAIAGAKDYIDGLIAEWNKQNPNIQVEATVVRPLTEERIKFISAVSVGEAPDIVYFSSPYIPELADMGALAPLETILPKEFTDQFTENVNKLQTYNGHLYAIPFEGPTWGMFYRKDLFKEVGLDPEKPPTTWEELLTYARRLTKKDASGKITRYGLAFPAKAQEAYEYWLSFVAQAGGQLATYDAQAKKWKSAINTPEVKKATEFWASLVQKEGVTPPAESTVAMNWEGAAQGLVGGQYAMVFDGMWAMSTIQSGLPKEKWGSAVFPAGPAGYGTLGFPISLAVSSQSKNKAEVARFLQWLLSAEHHNKYASLTTTMSWRKDFVNTDFAKDPLVQPFVAATKFAVAPPGTPFFGIYRDKVLWPTLQQILLGQLSVDAGLKQLDQEFTKLHG